MTGPPAPSVGDLPTAGEAPPPSTRTLPPADAPPGYVIEGELGRGGMGVVYLARQAGLNRPVALKMVLDADPKAVLRFLAEAEAVASVRHPHVVEVYQYGEHAGRPFLAMEHLPGGTLRDAPAADPRAAAGLLAKVADGVAAAHAQGIVHRDLKPGNVLLDSAGEPKVTDFGLAKRGGSDLTKTSAVLGTPAYMPPEQAKGDTRFVGPPADVWALGVMLYERLTGRRPFPGDDHWATLAAVLRGDFPKPRVVNPGVPKDLERVCLRCLEPRPEDRYPAAGALAADLRRFLAGEPVSVRPAGRAERLVKWGRRNPTRAIAWGLTALCLVMLTAGGGAVALWRRAEAARAGLADEQAATAAALAGEQEAGRQAQAATRTAEAARGEADAARGKLETLGALRSVDLAYREFHAGAFWEARRLRDAVPEPLRQWEWRFVDRLLAAGELTLPGPDGMCTAVAVGPDGNLIATGWVNGSFGLYDLAAGKQRFAYRTPFPCIHLGFAADGRSMWAANAYGLRVELEVATGKRLSVTGANLPLATFFSPDGKLRATAAKDAGRTVVVADAVNGRTVCTLTGHTDAVYPFGAFTRDNRRVVTCGNDRTARVWDARSGKLLHTLAGHDEAVHMARFSPDGTRVVTGGLDAAVKVWDAATGKQLAGMRGHTAAVQTVAFSPDGRRVASGGIDGTARTWDAATGTPLAVLRNHTLQAGTLAFDPTGNHLVVGSYARVQVWDARVNPDAHPLAGDLGEPVRGELVRITDPTRRDARFTPDGGRVVGSWFGGVRVWDVATARPLATWKPHLSVVTSVAATADGKYLLAGTYAGEVSVWDAATFRKVATFDRHRGKVWFIAPLPDGSVASAGDDGTVRRWQPATAAELWHVTGYQPGRTALAVRPDGRRIAFGVKGTVRVVDAADGHPTGWFPTRMEWGACALGYSPDGRSLAVGDQGELVVWDVAAARERFRTGYLWSVLVDVAFTPDGKRVAAATADKDIKVWDVASGFETLTLRPNAGLLYSLQFDPAGERLLVGAARHPVVFNPQPPPPGREPAPPPRPAD